MKGGLSVSGNTFLTKGVMMDRLGKSIVLLNSAYLMAHPEHIGLYERILDPELEERVRNRITDKLKVGDQSLFGLMKEVYPIGEAPSELEQQHVFTKVFAQLCREGKVTWSGQGADAMAKLLSKKKD